MKSSDFYPEDNYKEYYKILRFFMRICGLWPYQTLFAKCFFFAMTLFLTEGVLVGQLSEAIQVRDDINEVIDCVPNITISFFCGTEYLGLIFNSGKLKKCIDRIFEDWKYLSSKVEVELLKSYTFQGKKLGILYIFYMLFTGFMFMVEPMAKMLVSRSDNSTNILETLPYRLQYGNIDIEKHYYEIIIHSYISVMSHMLILSSINLIYISFIQHACGIFAVIGYKLEHIGEESLGIELNVEKINDKNYWTALYCLRKHIKVIEFAELVDGSFSTSFLFTLGLHMLTLAVSGTQVLMHADEISEAVRFASLFISILIQLLWQCWQAQLLLDYSNIPYESVVQACWYNSSIRCKKVLILIMQRSSKPCEITAGSLITYSIETFSSVLRTSMSYFTVLQSMN